MNPLPSTVELIEVGPRDGLQNESVMVPVGEKVRLIEALVDGGLKHIQITSFVHPQRVPQMADAEALCARLNSYSGVHYSALALNLKGIERALSAGIRNIDMSVSASEAHSLRNANRTVAGAMAEYEIMVELARANHMKVRGGIQCAFGYEKPDDVDPDIVTGIARHFLNDLGVDELALADSSGLANPRQIASLLCTIIPIAAGRPIILHLHDTRGMGMANLLAALQNGVRHFDTSFGGLGGCPFITGASGNIATEDTAFMLQQMGIDTGIDLQKMARIANELETLLRKQSLPGKIYKLIPAKS